VIRQARAQRNRHALAGSPRSDGKSRARLTELFAEHVSELQAPSVLELGTRQSQANQSTMHRNWVPHAGEFLGTDIEQGSDVDIVADVHRLSAIVGIERFDVILSFSTFEHLKYPQLAAHEVMQALRVGGLLLVVTHQTFPLHSYPSDYFRFSTDALETLFPRQMGFEIAPSSLAISTAAIPVEPEAP
jgi:hypothetical protein